MYKEVKYCDYHREKLVHRLGNSGRKNVGVLVSVHFCCYNNTNCWFFEIEKKTSSLAGFRQK